MPGASNYMKIADSSSLSSLEFDFCFWFGLKILFYNSRRSQSQTFVEFIWFNLSCPEMFCKKDILKNSAKFTGKNPDKDSGAGVFLWSLQNF